MVRNASMEEPDGASRDGGQACGDGGAAHDTGAGGGAGAVPAAVQPQATQVPTAAQPQHASGRKKTVLIVVLLLLLCACIAIAVWALFFRSGPELAPDYAPDAEVHATDIGDAGADKLAQPDGGGAVSLTYSTEVSVDLSDAQAHLTFANPSKSNQSMVLQIIVQDTVVAQSGTIEPGKQVDTLDLLDGAAQELSAGGYDGTLLVLYYQPDSGEKATVNTEIPVNITVEE